MTSTISPMQPHGGFPYYDSEMKPHLVSQTSDLYGPQASWVSAPHGRKSMTPAVNYLNFSASNTPPPEDTMQLNQSGFSSSLRTDSNNTTAHTPSMYTAPVMQPGEGQAAAFDANSNSSMYSSASIFTASNTMANNRNAATISPLQTRFDMDDHDAISVDPYSFQGQPPRNMMSSLSSSNGSQDPPAKRRCDSPQTRYEESSPATAHSSGGRRRRSENAEPGSARAIYLEKNRKAASKCRSKQKMQQEDLVETARDVERRNRRLKAEVDMLKGGIQELMEIVGQHTDCTDGRLRAYVQREADRLASGTLRTPYVPPLPYAGSTSSAGGNGSPTPTLSSRSRS